MADVNPEARAVDEQVDRLIALDSAERDLTELPFSRRLGRARQESSAASESQTVRSPRLCRPTSYSRQFRTRYRDFAYLYWLRFGYFTGADSGSGALRQP